MSTIQIDPKLQRIDRPLTVGASSTQWDDLHWQVESTAAVADLLHRVAAAGSLDDANVIVANELCRFLQADSVAIALASNGSARVDIQAVSDVAHLEPTSEQATLLSDAMSESLVRHRQMGSQMGSKITIADTKADSRELMTLAHDRLLHHTASELIWSCPLIKDDQSVVGVWTARFGIRPENAERLIRFAQATASPLAETLGVSQKASEGLIARLRRAITQGDGSAKAKRIGMAMAFVFAAALIPIPHRISCLSTIQPTSQRFAVVPHDGILRHSHVAAGDLVSPGDLLAEMDATELELELADLVARQERAQKKADVHQSEDDPSATQLAQLEASELAAQADLLKFRLSRQRMVSPIAGLVLQCELDEATGAPVRTGDVLMQIASIESLRGEIEILESDFSHVSIGQTVRLVADGRPLEPIDACIEKIRPMSEVRNGQNVFIAEVTIDNADGRLRPGMQAHSKISAGYRPAGWVMLHRAWERAYGSLR